MHIDRGLLLALATLCLFSAINFVPLADAYTIGFTAPLFVTIPSIPLLEDRVGWRRWTAVLVGFAGVLIVIRPGLGAVHWALLLPLVVPDRSHKSICTELRSNHLESRHILAIFDSGI